MQVNTTHCDYQLHGVLHAIATQPQFQPCVNLILQIALEHTDAIGAAFHTTDDLALSVVVGVIDAGGLDVAAILDQPDALHYYDDGRLLAFAVRTPNRSYGVLLLNFAEQHSGEGTELECLESLADSLAIVSARAEQEQQRNLALAGVYSMADPLLVWDSSKRLLLVNPAAAALFGAVAVVGQPLADVISADDLLAFAAGERPLAEWVSGEKTFVPRVQPVGADADQPTSWFLTLHDVTRFKKLTRNQHEFISIVSHDIRSPMTAIRGFGEMVSNSKGLDDTQKYHLGKVMSGISQITSLLDNIQDAGRFDPETGFYDMTRVHCDLDELAHRIVDNHLLPAEKQELAVRVNVADDVPIINADKVMLERALTNLIDNAIKYTPNGSKVEVSVVVKDNSVVIGVHDNGLGISPENQKLLFQRHVRIARREHRKIKGSGLGLFIVKSVAQRHGGDAWVESIEGQGTTFFFSIPLAGENLVVRPES